MCFEKYEPVNWLIFGILQLIIFCMYTFVWDIPYIRIQDYRNTFDYFHFLRVNFTVYLLIFPKSAFVYSYAGLQEYIRLFCLLEQN